MSKTISFNPLTLPTYVMAKPAGSICNLNCSYCYYLEKEKLYQNRKKLEMSDELLELFTKSSRILKAEPLVARLNERNTLKQYKNKKVIGAEE